MAENHPIEVHDHFDGSAHCVQCGGPCKLTGALLFFTQLTRWLFECEVFQNRPLALGLMGQTLADAGVNIPAFKKRALETRFP